MSKFPLHAAVKEGNLLLLKKLVKKGLSINALDDSKQTPLHIASYEGNVEMVKILIDKYNAWIDAKDKSGWTSLHCACYNGNLEVVQELLERNASVFALTNDGDSPLHYFVRPRVKNFQLYEKVFYTMLGKGVEINKQNVLGETALHSSSFRGREQYVTLLLKNKADPNLCDDCRETCLHTAAREGHLEVVKLLVKFGGDINIVGKEGSCIDAAEKAGHTKIVNFLRTYAATGGNKSDSAENLTKKSSSDEIIQENGVSTTTQTSSPRPKASDGSHIFKKAVPSPATGVRVLPTPPSIPSPAGPPTIPSSNTPAPSSGGPIPPYKNLPVPPVASPGVFPSYPLPLPPQYSHPLPQPPLPNPHQQKPPKSLEQMLSEALKFYTINESFMIVISNTSIPTDKDWWKRKFANVLRKCKVAPTDKVVAVADNSADSHSGSSGSIPVTGSAGGVVFSYKGIYFSSDTGGEGFIDYTQLPLVGVQKRHNSSVEVHMGNGKFAHIRGLDGDQFCQLLFDVMNTVDRYHRNLHSQSSFLSMLQRYPSSTSLNAQNVPATTPNSQTNPFGPYAAMNQFQVTGVPYLPNQYLPPYAPNATNPYGFIPQYANMPPQMANPYAMPTSIPLVSPPIQQLYIAIKSGVPEALHELAKQPNHEEVYNVFMACLDVLFVTSLNTKDAFGCTPFHYAALAGNQQLYLCLHSLGSDPTIKNNEGKTPFEIMQEVLGYELDEKYSHVVELPP